MKETKNVRTHAGWYKSYMDDEQGIALIETLECRVHQLECLIENIKGELELCDDPKEAEPIVVIESVRSLIDQIDTVSSEKGYFRWEM